MAFNGDQFPVYADGPRNDLSIGYLTATVNDTTTTIVANKTSKGFSLGAFGSGIATVTFPKCRFLAVVGKNYAPATLATVAQHRLINTDEAIDATTGTFNINVCQTSDGVVTQPAAVANEITLVFLYGF
jgi:hypothetical protein